MALVGRHNKVAFYGVEQDGETVFYRMTGFTRMAVSKNPAEYSRQYIDESFRQTDVTGYSPSIAYSFDQYSDNPVHRDLAAISDRECIGSDALRSIVIVDMSRAEGEEGGFAAQLRQYAVIPQGEGASLDAYTYTGTFRTKSKVVFGRAVSEDGWNTAIFTEV